MTIMELMVLTMITKKVIMVIVVTTITMDLIMTMVLDDHSDHGVHDYDDLGDHNGYHADLETVQWRKESVTIIESQEPLEDDNEVVGGHRHVEDK